MFLPVILQKYFGNGAWLFFIIFNIIGATAFSFFITSKEKSTIFVEKNKSACVSFSLVTIIFQAFFVGWVITHLSAVELLLILCFLCLLLVNWHGNLSFVSVIVWILSLLIFMAYVINQPGAAVIVNIEHQFTDIDTKVFYILPLLALGFLLCPYLDLTFHQVVQAASEKTERGNRTSFLIGFPLLFSILMIFSLVYVDTAEQIFLLPDKMATTIFIKLLLFYFVMQSSFTGIAHWYKLQHKINITQKRWVGAGILFMLALPWLASTMANEMTYRLFMGFYGILAPAYVWIVVINKRILLSKIAIFAVGVSLLLASVPLFYQAAEYYYCYALAVIVVLITPLMKRK